ncbi:hypothetical protein L6452_34331 [Arctium lappa]|uniref:Uncharacterized protein n=1 Tax=Arctium lappa TaxID=4217 RepID=A0ACB8YIW9_ARCLA|nr:hypothetical protein L6452_34331 [Arctium lappa]
MKTITIRPTTITDALEAVKCYMNSECTLINNPEFDMTYLNGKGEPCFIRFSQIARYCDGTLILLRDKLRCFIDQDDKGVQSLDPYYRRLVLKALGQIEERLEYRTSLRYFEISFGFRRRYVSNWQQFELLFKGGRLLGCVLC